jgi:hypothetical protein
MTIHNPGLIKRFLASGAISARRIVKMASDTQVAQASAATDYLIGVTVELDVTSGEPVDIVVSGATKVAYGANVTRGQLLTSDANGKAIPYAGKADANYRIIGVAAQSGVSGDIGSMIIVQSESALNDGLVKTYVADNAVTAGQVVKIGDSDADCDVATADTDAIFGIALNSATQGSTVYVQVGGVADGTSSAAITRGAIVTATTAGKLVTASPVNGVDSRCVGIALETASGADESIAVLIVPKVKPYNNLMIDTFVADNPVTAGNVIKIGTDADHCDVAGAATSALGILGVALNSGLADATIYVKLGGKASGVASEAISAGILVTSAASGKIAPCAPGAAERLRSLGVALSDATLDGDAVDINIAPGMVTGLPA